MDGLKPTEDFPGRIIHVATLWENAQLLLELIGTSNTLIDSRDSWGRTALHVAATNHSSVCLKLLLRHNANVLAQCGARGEGRTPLHIAAEYGNVENVRALVSHGISDILTVKDHLGLTPVDLAEKCGHSLIVTILQDSAKLFEERQSSIIDSLSEFIRCEDRVGGNVQFMSHFSRSLSILNFNNVRTTGSDCTSNCTFICVLLSEACFHNNSYICEQLIEYIVKSSSIENQSQRMSENNYSNHLSPLMIVCQSGNKEILDLLLKYKIYSHVNVKLSSSHMFSNIILSALNQCLLSGHLSLAEHIMLFDFNCSRHQKIFRTENSIHTCAFDINAYLDGNIDPSTDRLCGREERITILYSVLKDKNNRSVNETLNSFISFQIRSIIISDSDDFTDCNVVKFLSKFEKRFQKNGSSENQVVVQSSSSRVKHFFNNFTYIHRNHLSQDYESSPQDATVKIVDPSSYKRSYSLNFFPKQRQLLNNQINENISYKWINVLDLNVICHSQASHLYTKSMSTNVIMVSEPVINLIIRQLNDVSLCECLLKCDSNVIHSKYSFPKGKSSESDRIFYGFYGFDIDDASSKHLLESLDCLMFHQSIKQVTCLADAVRNDNLEMVEFILDRLEQLQIHVKDYVKSFSFALNVAFNFKNKYVISKILNFMYKQNVYESFPEEDGEGVLKKFHMTVEWRDLHRLDFIHDEYLFECVKSHVGSTVGLATHNHHNLSVITELNFQNCSLKHLPLCLWSFPNEKNNKKKTGYLHNLEKLNVSRNRLECVLMKDYEFSADCCYGVLPMLSVIDLSDNYITDVPAQLFESSTPNLTKLNFAKNKICDIPPSFLSSLKSLKELNLSSNDISELEFDMSLCNKKFKLLVECEESSCDSHQISLQRQLNFWETENSGLGIVSRRSHHLSDMDDGLAHKSLLKLDLSKNKLSKISSNFHLFFPNLRELNLSMNYLESLTCYDHHQLILPYQLQYFNLSYNNIKDVYSENKSSQQQTHAGKSQQNIRQLSKLSHLNLSNNQLKECSQIFNSSMFSNVSNLDLSENSITQLLQVDDDEMIKLTQLSVLNLSGNVYLQDLPTQLSTLPKLWNLNVTNCPNLKEPLLTMTNARHHVVNSPSSGSSYKTCDILDHLRCVMNKSKMFPLMQVFILGSPQSGKTSLVQLLKEVPGSTNASFDVFNLKKFDVSTKTKESRSIDGRLASAGALSDSRRDRMSRRQKLNKRRPNGNLLLNNKQRCISQSRNCASELDEKTAKSTRSSHIRSEWRVRSSSVFSGASSSVSQATTEIVSIGKDRESVELNVQYWTFDKRQTMPSCIDANTSSEHYAGREMFTPSRGPVTFRLVDLKFPPGSDGAPLEGSKSSSEHSSSSKAGNFELSSTSRRRSLNLNHLFLPYLVPKNNTSFRRGSSGGNSSLSISSKMKRPPLFIVSWRLDEGERRGVMTNLKRDLKLIHSFAQNAHVIIVGTHLDIVKSDSFPSSYSIYLDECIHNMFINVTEAELKGLPKVVASIQVSCRTKENIRELSHLIYDVAFSLKTTMLSSSTLFHSNLVLEQKIPISYITCAHITHNFHTYFEHSDMSQKFVMQKSTFKRDLKRVLFRHFYMKFRDDDDSEMALNFLKDIGLIIHYTDGTSLSDVVFFDAQYLIQCLFRVTQLAQVYSRDPSSTCNPTNTLTRKKSLCSILDSVSSSTDLEPNFDSIKSLVLTDFEAVEKAFFFSEEEDTKLPLSRTQILQLLYKFNLVLPIMMLRQQTPILPTLFSCTKNLTGVKNLSESYQRALLLPSKMMSSDNIDGSNGHIFPLEYKSNDSKKRSSVESCNSSIQYDGLSGPAVVPNIITRFQRRRLIKNLPPSKGRDPQPGHKSGRKEAVPLILSKSSCNNNVIDSLNVEQSSRSEISYITDRELEIRRYFLMTYIPIHLFDQLISAILSDTSDFILPLLAAGNFFETENTEVDVVSETRWIIHSDCIKLQCFDSTLIEVRNVSKKNIDLSKTRCWLFKEQCDILVDSTDSQFESGVSGESWNRVTHRFESDEILEISVPQTNIVVKKFTIGSDESDVEIMKECFVLEPKSSSVASLLSFVVRHIDRLLEDNYPSLGTHFLHTSEGRQLVSRLIPCPRCFSRLQDGVIDNTKSPKMYPSHITTIDRKHGPKYKNVSSVRGKTLMDVDNHDNTIDSGVSTFRADKRSSWCHDDIQTTPSPISSVHVETSGPSLALVMLPKVYTFTFEACVNRVFNGGIEKGEEESGSHLFMTCPDHGSISTSQIAPDITSCHSSSASLIVFSGDRLKFGETLGQGAFGSVYAGQVLTQKSIELQDSCWQKVAIKSFQLDKIDVENNVPSFEDSIKALQSFHAEMNILNFSHKRSSITQLIGVCLNPLAIILELSPQGSLDSILKLYRKCDAYLSVFIQQRVMLGVCKALEYLHSEKVIFRDLKGGNVLVWNIPMPLDISTQKHVDLQKPCQVKLCDFGIARKRCSNDYPIKGFAGTEGYMAPEVAYMRSGEECEYTEKVDIFSYGMLLFEIISRGKPFCSSNSEDPDDDMTDTLASKESILNGSYPTLMCQDVTYCPTYAIDVMCKCWRQSPSQRPSASQLVSIISAPEFANFHSVYRLQDAPISRNQPSNVDDFVIVDQNTTRHHENFMPMNQLRRPDFAHTTANFSQPILLVCDENNSLVCMAGRGGSMLLRKHDVNVEGGSFVLLIFKVLDDYSLKLLDVNYCNNNQSITSACFINNQSNESDVTSSSCVLVTGHKGGTLSGYRVITAEDGNSLQYKDVDNIEFDLTGNEFGYLDDRGSSIEVRNMTKLKSSKDSSDNKIFCLLLKHMNCLEDEVLFCSIPSLIASMVKSRAYDRRFPSSNFIIKRVNLTPIPATELSLTCLSVFCGASHGLTCSTLTQTKLRSSTRGPQSLYSSKLSKQLMSTYSSIFNPNKEQQQQRSLQLWCGVENYSFSQTHPSLIVYQLNETLDIIDKKEIDLMLHSESPICESMITQIEFSNRDDGFAFTFYSHTIYMISIKSLRVISKLNVSRLAPSSESLNTFTLSTMRQFCGSLCSDVPNITCLSLKSDPVNADNNFTSLFVGTNQGCLITIKCDVVGSMKATRSPSLRPVAVCKPYQKDLSHICWLSNRSSFLCLGQNFRGLIERYVEESLDDTADVDVGKDEVVLPIEKHLHKHDLTLWNDMSWFIDE